MAARLTPAYQTFNTANGSSPLAGGKIHFYVSGSVSTNKDTFSDDTLLTANTNPIILDSAGRIQVDVWGDGEYKMVVSDSADTPISTFDPVSGSFSATRLESISSLTALLKSTLTNGDLFNVTGYNTQGDGGGGDFYWVSASTDTANVYNTFAADEGGTGRWKRIQDAIPTILQGGAVAGTDITPVTDAITTAIGKGIIDVPEGTWSFNPPLALTTGITLKGRGYADSAGAAATILKKLSGGDGVVLSGDSAQLQDLEIDGNSQTGDGFLITGSRVYVSRVLTHSNGQDGWRIGKTADGGGTINANLWQMERIISISNTRHGGFIEHTNTNTGTTFPLGVPDVNAGVLTGYDARLNGSDGLKMGNSIDNKFFGISCQENTGRGLVLTDDARGHRFYGIYLEGNSAGTDNVEYDLQAGATGNLIDGERFGSVNPITINTPGEANKIITQLGTRWWAQNDVIGVVSTVADGPTSMKYESSGASGDVNVETIGKRTGTSGGEFVIQTKADGGVLTDRLTITNNGLGILSSSQGMLFGKTATDRTVAGIHVNESNGMIALAKAGAINDTQIGFYRNSSATAVGSITSDSTSTAFNTSSDYRLEWKKNKVLLTGASDRIKNLKLYNFPDVGKAGVIAHELQEIIPYAVTYEKDSIDKEGNPIMQQVDYSKVIPDIISTLQDILTRLDK